MKRLTDRRAVLLAAGLLAAGVAVDVEMAAAQSADISGTVIYAGAAKIPEGHIRIYLEDPAGADKTVRAAGAQLKSDGGTKAIAFSLSLPARAAVSPTLQVVARLERGDGWLLARGSTTLVAGTPVEITLNTVMY